MKLNRNKGITLIALVVTIIVLLILAGVTLSLALNNNGIIGRSKNAAARYSEAELAEREELDRIAGEMDEVMGILPSLEIPDDLKEGDKITYAPSGEFHWNAELATSYEKDSSDYNNADMQLATGDKVTDGKEDMSLTEWNVYSIDRENGKIVLMPTKSTAGYTEDYSSFWGCVTLSGTQGYNNAIKLLNDACGALYGNPKEGIIARSINLEDYEIVMEEEAIEDKNETGKTLIQSAKEKNQPPFGFRFTTANTENYRDNEGNYIGHRKIPAIYAQEKNSIINGILNTNGLDRSKQNSYISRTESVKIGNTNYTSTNGYVQPNSIRPEQTAYSMEYDKLEEALGSKSKYILPNGNLTTGFIASRCVELRENDCEFRILGKSSQKLTSIKLMKSDGSIYLAINGLFPVVTISSGVISGNASEGYTFIVE